MSSPLLCMFAAKSTNKFMELTFGRCKTGVAGMSDAIGQEAISWTQVLIQETQSAFDSIKDVLANSYGIGVNTERHPKVDVTGVCTENKTWERIILGTGVTRIYGISIAASPSTTGTAEVWAVAITTGDFTPSAVSNYEDMPESKIYGQNHRSCTLHKIIPPFTTGGSLMFTTMPVGYPQHSHGDVMLHAPIDRYSVPPRGIAVWAWWGVDSPDPPRLSVSLNVTPGVY